MRFDHFLLIGFGGPTRPEEVRPFLEQVARGTRIPEERLRQVESQYAQSGGFSPYNRHAACLQMKLQERLPKTPIFLGMRNWHPFLKEILSEIRGQGLRRGLAVVLAPHRSPASHDRYLQALEESRKEAGAPDLSYEVLRPWYDHLLFVQAQAERVREAWDPSAVDGRAETELVFTAHSIPEEMARGCPYEEEIRSSSQAVARELGQDRWRVAYQSRSGDPRQPWLGPAVRDLPAGLRQAGTRQAVVVPIGFLFDHTEVLYDLDLDAKRRFEEAGITFRRSPTVMDHPKFVEMLAQLLEKEQCR